MALYMRVQYRSRQKGQLNAVHVKCPPLACNLQALKCVGNLSWLEGREARPPVEPLPNSDFGLAWPLQFARSLKLSTERRRVLGGVEGFHVWHVSTVCRVFGNWLSYSKLRFPEVCVVTVSWTYACCLLAFCAADSAASAAPAATHTHTYPSIHTHPITIPEYYSRTRSRTSGRKESTQEQY